MGKSDADKLNFGTKDEYDCFISGIDRENKYYVIFEILFWTGCREGEMLALTKEDVDFENNQISITKTYYTERRDIITKSLIHSIERHAEQAAHEAVSENILQHLSIRYHYHLKLHRPEMTLIPNFNY